MKLNNPLIRKIGATAMGVLLLIYIGYQIVLVNDKGIATQTAMYAQVSDAIQTTGWAVRNEVLVSATTGGVLSYNVADGGKVAKGNVIADVYANEDNAAAQGQLEQLQTEINNLEVLKSVGDAYVSSADMVGTQINTSLVTLLQQVQNGTFATAAVEREQLLYLLNQKRVVTGKESVTAYESRLAELKQEQALANTKAAQKTGYIEAAEAGYFISGTDGYEGAFDIAGIADITVKEIQAVQKQTVPADAVGKIAKDFLWHMVCVVDEEQKIKLERVSDVTIEIPLTAAGKIPARVVSMNKDEETGLYALVLQCDYMNASLAEIRSETIQIVAQSYSGVLVSQKALHFETVTQEITDEAGNVTQKVTQNVKGVYVKYGQRISFVQVFSDITINGDAVCKLNLNDQEKELLVTENTIRLYDEVVTGGTDLYDGKLV